ncbi:MAG: hypothetical protein GY828_01205, partial [Candidatus Gracilibacteria bacterium]|nr:hypothetical protein [Candidatus Gracilibacteria bacterium]
IEEKNKYNWNYKTYKGKFQIKGKVLSQYYNGAFVSDADFSYKVYKQKYYPNNYWEGCYYGCYWEPSKVFYTEGKGKLSADGKGDFLIDVEFQSEYSDYKYIVEVTVKDKAGDVISGTNSSVVFLPEKYKHYNWNSSLHFQTDTRFVKKGEQVHIHGGLNVGEWATSYDNIAVVLVKKKDYHVNYVEDIRGKRPMNSVEETLVDMFYINDSKFSKDTDGKLHLDYTLPETGEYVFEYSMLGVTDRMIQNLGLTGEELDIHVLRSIVHEFIHQKKEVIPFIYNKQKKKIYLDDLFQAEKKFMSVVSYGEKSAKNPEKHDNKIHVLSEKVSYK